MIKLVFRSLFFALLLCLGCSKCQQSNTASNDKNTEGAAARAFKKQFPKAQDIQWDSADNGLVATFNDGTYQSEAFFDLNGQYQYLTTSIDFEALPQSVQAFIQKKYTIDDIAFIQKIEDKKEKMYHIELKTDKEYINLEFDLNGKFLKENKTPLSNEELQSEEEEGVE
jgi:hypothetical protein